MRKAAPAMALIGWNPPVCSFLILEGAKRSSLRPCLELLRRGSRRRGRSRRGRLAGRVAEELEEVRVRPQQEPGIVSLQPVPIPAPPPVHPTTISFLALTPA